jgi:hypothetical protein
MRKRSAAQNAPWVLKQEGGIVCGLVTGRFTRANNPNQHYYQVSLSQPCEVALKGGEVQVAEPGTIVSLDEIGALKAIADAVKEGEPHIWVRFIDKKPQRLDPSKSYWDVELFTGAEELPI